MKNIICFILFMVPIIVFSQRRDYNFNGNECDVFSLSTDYEGQSITGEYLVILGDENTNITRPYIIVEGIDIKEDQEFDSHIGLYNEGNPFTRVEGSLIDELLTDGYDVVILDYDKSTIEIQKNAMLFVELLNVVNNQKVIPNEDNTVVMGYSMGGLVTRYGLTWMEANNLNHHTKLYVSHDAPHKGANLPLGLQEAFRLVATKTAFGLGTILIPSVYKSFPAFFQMFIYSDRATGNGIAKPAEDKNTFFEELYMLNPDSNGYPKLSYNVAIANGSDRGVTQIGISEGDEIFSINYFKENGTYSYRGGCSFWDWLFDRSCAKTYSNGDDVIDLSVKLGFLDSNTSMVDYEFYHLITKGGHYNPPIAITGGPAQVFMNEDNFSYDIAPGSTFDAFTEIIENIDLSGIGDGSASLNTGATNFCFMPTISALDYNMTSNDELLNKNIFNSNDFRDNSNFDDYIANTTNENHFDFNNNQRDFVLVNLDAPVLERIIYKDKNVVVDNSTLQNNAKITGLNSIETSGNINIDSGDYTFISGEKVILKDGFSTSGGELTIQIKNEDSFRKSIEFKHNIIAENLTERESSRTSIVSKTSNFNLEIEYLDNESIVDKDAADELMRDIITTVFHDEQVEISFSHELNYEGILLNVRDIHGNTVSNNFVKGQEIILNINNLDKNNLIFISIMFDGFYTYSYNTILLNN